MYNCLLLDCADLWLRHFCLALQHKLFSVTYDSGVAAYTIVCAEYARS